VLKKNFIQLQLIPGAATDRQQTELRVDFALVKETNHLSSIHTYFGKKTLNCSGVELKIVRTGAPSSNNTTIGIARRTIRAKHSFLARSICIQLPYKVEV
jgi:hypothetical protein